MALKFSFPTRSKHYVVRLDRVTVRLISPDEKAQWDELIQNYHFLHATHLPGNTLRYVAELNGKCMALISFSAPSFHLRRRDEWIGWSEAQLFQRRHFVVQNSRLLVMPDIKLKNLSSRVLSLCLHRLNTDWEKHFGHPVLLVETFIDPAYHRGTCYKAANWIRLGETQGFRRSGRGFYECHGSPKALWVYPLRSDACNILSGKELPMELALHEKPLSAEFVLSKLKTEPLKSLFDHLRTVPDVRGRKGRRYSLASCLAIVTCGILAGCKGLAECAELAKSLNQAQRQVLGIGRNPGTGKYEAPSHTTLWRTVAKTDPEEFERVAEAWFNHQQNDLPEAISIDGKALRATLDQNQKGHYVVSAVSHNPKNFFFRKV